MCRNTQHTVPRILSQDKRDDRMTICGDLISSADDDPTFLNRIITGDKTWYNKLPLPGFEVVVNHSNL